MKEFKKKVTEDNYYYRNNLKDNYTFIEKFAKYKYKTGNYLDYISNETNMIKSNSKEIIEIIKQDYIKSNSLGFELNQTVKNATDFLRKELLNQKIDVIYKKGAERAVFELLKQIRDNITHNGKFEITEEQYRRNFKLVKNASIITEEVVNFIEKKSE